MLLPRFDYTLSWNFKVWLWRKALLRHATTCFRDWRLSLGTGWEFLWNSLEINMNCKEFYELLGLLYDRAYGLFGFRGLRAPAAMDLRSQTQLLTLSRGGPSSERIVCYTRAPRGAPEALWSQQGPYKAVAYLPVKS